MEIFGYSIPADLLLKLVALGLLAFVVNFVYTWKTGRNLTDDRNRVRPHRASATDTVQGRDGADR